MTEHIEKKPWYIEKRIDLSFVLALGLQLVTIGIIYGMDYQKWQNQAQINQQVATTLQGIQTELQNMHDEQIGHEYRLNNLEADKAKK